LLNHTSVFKFLRKSYIGFHDGSVCSTLQFYPQNTKSLSHFSLFLRVAILSVVVLICFPWLILMLRTFLCIYWPQVFLLQKKKKFIKVLCLALMGCFISVVWIHYMFWILISYWIFRLQNFLRFHSLPFHSIDCFLCC